MMKNEQAHALLLDSTIIDGFIEKKSKWKGTWAKRYVRTDRFTLMYFTDGLRQIELNKVHDGGTATSPYHYRTVGVDPSEEVDLRAVEARDIQVCVRRAVCARAAPRAAR